MGEFLAPPSKLKEVCEWGMWTRVVIKILQGVGRLWACLNEGRMWHKCRNPFYGIYSSNYIQISIWNVTGPLERWWEKLCPPIIGHSSNGWQQLISRKVWFKNVIWPALCWNIKGINNKWKGCSNSHSNTSF